MAVTSTPIFPQTVGTGFAQIAPADTTALKTLYTAGADGSTIENIIVTSTDTSARDLQFVVTISAVDYIIGSLTIPLSSGNTAAAPPVSVFRHANFASILTIDGTGNPIIRLPTGAVLKVRALTTVTATRVISVICQGGNF